MARAKKQRGYPDRRGLLAESDVISEQFVPSEQYKSQQKVMKQTLIAAGLSPEEIETMLVIPVDSTLSKRCDDEPKKK
jgi:hypothetical protein